VGGHYPVDIAASILLALLAIAVIDLLFCNRRVTNAFERASSQGLASEVIFFLWLFEVAEGFKSAEHIANALAKLLN